MSVTSCQVPCCYRPEKELLMTATKPIAMSAEQVRSIALETGVTEAQIRMIVSLIGLDRSSVVREARILKKAR
jgi:hypothetical protein